MVCIFIYKRRNTFCIFVFVFVYLCICVFVFVYLFLCICICLFVFVYLYLCICMCVFVCLCLYLYLNVCICICICVFVYLHIWTIPPTDLWTPTQMSSQTVFVLVIAIGCQAIEVDDFWQWSSKKGKKMATWGKDAGMLGNVYIALLCAAPVYLH